MTTATISSHAIKLRNRLLLWSLYILASVIIPLEGLSQTGPPDITYTTPNVYPVNMPMTLAPTNNGGAVGRVIRGTFSNVAGPVDDAQGNVNGQGIAARFNRPGGLAVDRDGNLYVADKDNKSVRKVTPDGTVSTFATTNMNQPWGIEVHPVTGDIYVSDNGNHLILKITPAGGVSVFAGSTEGFADGTATTAKFKGPQDLMFDAAGNLYVADSGNKRIRKISPQGNVVTMAGNGTQGNDDGTGTAASFNTANGLTLDQSGNLVIADYVSNIIRKMTPAGLVSTYAGTTAPGYRDDLVGAAIFNNPSHMITDYAGNIYVSDSRNDRIRKISTGGVVTTVVGSPVFGSNRGDDIGNGDPTKAKLYNPVGLAYDKFANLYIADEHNNKIKKLALGGYVISGPALPQGLTFDPTTGIISGTPTQLTQESDYVVTAYNGFGEDSFKFTIRVIPTAVYLIPFAPATICDDDIDPAGLSNLPLTYTSSNPDVAKINPVTNMIELVGIGVTTITATNSLGTDSQVLQVSDYALPLITVKSDKTVLCPGANAVITATTSGAGKNPTFEWYLNGKLVVKNDSKTYTAINPSLNDKFTVRVTNNDYCYPVISLESDPVVLSPVPPPPTTSITMSPEGPSCAGTVLTFKAQIQGNVATNAPLPKWYVNGKDAGNTSLEFKSDKLRAGDVVTYIVPFINPCGPSQAALSNEIVVEYRKAELCSIAPPTAFSPNGDGVNDTWNIEYLVGFPNCHVRVFSRFGQKLYDSTGYNTPWDGSSKGESLPAGTYYYVIALEKDMETVSGSITIIK